MRGRARSRPRSRARLGWAAGLLGSVRARLVLGTVAVLLVGLLAVDVTAWVALERHLAARTDEALEATADRLGALEPGRQVVVGADRVAALVPGDALVVAVTEDDGQVVLRSPAGQPAAAAESAVAAALAAPAGEPVTTGEGDAAARVLRVVLADDALEVRDEDGRVEQVSQVVVGTTTSADAAALHTLAVVEVLAGLLVLLAGLLLSSGVVVLGLRPLRVLARAARGVAEAGGRGEEQPLPVGRPGTETHEVASTLNQALAARARSEATVRRLVADASHELRTPVAALVAWGDLFEAGALPDAAAKDEALASVALESARLRHLVEELLVLARMDAGAPARVEPVDLVSLARESCAALGVLAGDDERGAPRLTGPAPEEPPVLVRGDAAALRRLVDNLVVNAIRHGLGAASSPATRVRVRVAAGAVLEVSDDGPGLAPDQLAVATERFWRASPGREHASSASAGSSGSGLGLAIAAGTARAHGGSLALLAGRPTGLVARLVLPGDDGVVSESSGTRQPAVGSSSGPGRGDGGGLGSVSTEQSTPRTEQAPERAPEHARGGRALARLADLPVTRPRGVLAAWSVAVVLLVAALTAWGGTYTDDIDIPGSQAVEASSLLAEHRTGGGGFSSTVVLHDDQGLAGQERALDAFAADLADVDGVTAVSAPLADGSVSADGTTATLTLQTRVNPRSLDDASLDGLRAAADDLVSDAPAVEVSWADVLGEAIDDGSGGHLAEGIGIAVALLVLLLTFGSVLAAVLPVATAVVGGVAGVALLGLLASQVTLGTSAPTLALMIGLGCGIDYGLFLLTRARQRLLEGAEPRAAVRAALRSSGHSVVVAAATVAVALLGLYASGISFVGRLGLAAVVTLATAALAALTVVPAVTVLLGRRLDRVRVRTPVAEEPVGPAEAAGAAGATLAASRWARFARGVARHPVAVVVLAVLLLGTLALPVASLRLGHVDAGADPVGTTTRTAYDRLVEGFGEGAPASISVVLDLPTTGSGSGDVDDDLEAARRLVAGTEGVASVSAFTVTEDGAVATARVVPTTEPQDAATTATVHRLMDSTEQQVADATGARMLLTGSTVGQVELADTLTARLPLIVALVVGAAFVLLTLTFRSPVIALKAAVMNLVSIGASYGVVVAVFQWQWGSGLLGLDEAVPVESFVPMMMFAIVFGLSMDYEVFLLSRVREEHLAGRATTEAVAVGLAATARVITAAALIMVSVFTAFAFTGDVVITMLAVGLAVSVLIDATVVRLLLVPATMVLLREANWWLPRWLDRLLPGGAAQASAAAPPESSRARPSSPVSSQS
ncbi:MMPL family transporter [Nocardioides sp. GY 10127]|uniref:MMPL family transporter n=1 Tax=Nocardioides sp. GY 10127 TaxID=2569762 RepID=UPI0010A91C1C|nr:MMPL family transporter [Nocardioides sp. GY 10127]TIC84066.1 hypothetical protein E8D37_04465 [Nocardioides sp. GY 10127]